jgi:hypothetical protein
LVEVVGERREKERTLMDGRDGCLYRRDPEPVMFPEVAIYHLQLLHIVLPPCINAGER